MMRELTPKEAAILKKMRPTPKKRLERLYRLRDVVSLHIGKKSRKVKLDGSWRAWDMDSWDCGTSACAFGCYALTPYGRRHFNRKVCSGEVVAISLKLPKNVRLEHPHGIALSNTVVAAVHFGITEGEAGWLFLPTEYNSFFTKIPPSQVRKRIDALIKKYQEQND